MQRVRLITPCAGELLSLLGGSFNGKPIVLGDVSIEVEYIPEDMTQFELMQALLCDLENRLSVHRDELFFKHVYQQNLPEDGSRLWLCQILSA